MIAIVESRADEASEHICEHVRQIGEFEEREDGTRRDVQGGGTYYRSEQFELRSFDALHLELENAATAFDDPEFLVFASRHAGDTGPLLSAHVTGNFGEAEYGGDDRSLAAAPPNALAAVLASLEEHAPDPYDVSLECTHHGPTDVRAPSMFVELGSGPEEWADPEGAAAVARAILDLAGEPAQVPSENGRRRHLVGIGGGHYAPRFTRIAAETDWAVGHVAADWSLDELGDPTTHDDVLAAAFEQSGADHAVLDGDHPEVADAVEDLGYRIVSETWVRETDGVPLPIVDAAEERLCAVDDGLRFAAVARDDTPAPAELEEIELPGELVDRAQGIDREATIAAVDRATVAYETSEGGTRVGDRVLASATAIETGTEGLPGDLLDTLVAVLEQRYDAVSVDDGRVLADETAFDPELAHEAGVPEGPAFGRLADGETVEVDGAPVAPEDVARTRQQTFPLGVGPEE